MNTILCGALVKSNQYPRRVHLSKRIHFPQSCVCHTMVSFPSFTACSWGFLFLAVACRGKAGGAMVQGERWCSGLRHPPGTYIGDRYPIKTLVSKGNNGGIQNKEVAPGMLPNQWIGYRHHQTFAHPWLFDL